MADVKVPSLNRVIIAGRMTRNPELKTTANGKNVCRGGIAHTRYYRSNDGERREEISFWNFVAFGKHGEWVAQNLRKGMSAVIDGRLQQWEDKDGNKHTQIASDSVMPNEWDSTSTSSGSSHQSKPRQSYAQNNASSPVEEPIPEDDMPF